MRINWKKWLGIGAAVGTGAAVVIWAAKPSASDVRGATIKQTVAFNSPADLLNLIQVQFVNPNGKEIVTYRLEFIRRGFEGGSPHYIYFYDWPFNNPGEISLDLGAVLDLWGPRPDNGDFYYTNQPAHLWSIEFANFDDETKTLVIDHITRQVPTEAVFLITQLEAAV
jgi:hypothetical protein